MRREVIAAGIVGMAILGLAVFSMSRESARRAASSDTSLVSVNPIESPSGDLSPSTPAAPAPRRTGGFGASFGNLTVAAGTNVPVTINTRISSEEAGVGDSWSGVVASDVYSHGNLVIPAGTTVHGTVAAATPAKRGDRAMLQLHLSRIQIADRSYGVSGSSEPVIAGSTRARNLGAIAGGTAAGAIIGHTVGGSGKGTLIGGLLGGAVATGAVAKSKGWQVVLKEGTQLTFTTQKSVAVSKRAVNDEMAAR